MERIVLITNLIGVDIGSDAARVRTYTNALVLFDRGPKGSGDRYRAMGFHNEPHNPTFVLTLPSLEWAIEPLAFNRRFALRFADMESKGTPAIELDADFANDLPLDIEHLEGRTWSDVVVRKVLRYYHAPYFMLMQQHDAETMRKLMNVEGVS